MSKITQGRSIYVDGQWSEASDGQTIPVINPSSGETIGAISRGTPDDVDRALTAARRAFKGQWGRVSPADRGRILTRLGMLIAEHVDELAMIECHDVGKPLVQARRDIEACARYCEFYGGAADKVHGETLPYENGYLVLTLREPHGVTGHIIPWNYPAQMFGRSVIASLAAGNAVVIKPGEDACQSVLAIAELTAAAGLPKGALNVVTGFGHEAGAALAGHAQVDHISFTGSPATGGLVQQAAAAHNRPSTMELGGKSPQLVFADADLTLALPSLYGALIQNAGQTCSAGSRILIERSRFDEVVEALSERFRMTQVGPAETNPDCGPLISARQQERVRGFIERAEAAGLAAVAAAGSGSSSAGFYVEPRLYAPIDVDHELATAEVFGPVLIATPFDDEESAVRIANETEYGLVAGVWTQDGARQLRLARNLDCGQVFVNTYGAGGGVELPFGGVKRSGYGREKGMEGIYSFTRLKTVALRHG